MAVEKKTGNESKGDTVAYASVVSFKGRRWTVGTMVTVSIVFAAALMVLLQFMTFRAQRPLKWDLTSSGINSLNTGTRSVLGSLEDGKIHLTSLYLETDIESDAQGKYRSAVDDLLRLYQSEQPTKIEIDWINPLKDQPKLASLLERVRGREQFKKETEPYAAAIERFEQEILEPFRTELQGYVTRLNAIDQSAALAGGAPPSAGIGRAVTSWVELGAKVLEDVHAIQSQPMPRYSTATSGILNFYDTVGGKVDLVINAWADQKIRDNKLDDAVKDVLASMKVGLKPWIERFEQEKQNLEELPGLELDELERALQQNNSIVVESEAGARALSFEEVWPPLHEGSFVGQNDFDKRRFAGEGAITPAILQLIQNEKTALVFVRRGGPRLFGISGFGPTAQRGAHTALKAELEKLNYAVAEWDLKATQAKPTFDVEPARTIYIVLRASPNTNPQGIPMPGSLGPLERAAVLNAIGESGRAVFFTGWEFMAPKYEYQEFLSKKWGIEVGGESMIITAVTIGPSQWGLARNFHTVSSVKFSEHVLTKGLEFLQKQCAFPMSTSIRRADEVPEEVTVAQLAFVPASEDVWGVKDPPGFVNRYRDEGKTGKTADDLPGPFPMGFASAKGEDKVVVLAAGAEMISDDLAVNNMLVMGPGGLQVQRRAPGNLALFLNVLHYLDDTLQWLNIGSPIDSSQIEITDSQLLLWRVLAVGVFPALALLSGGLVWYARRR